MNQTEPYQLPAVDQRAEYVRENFDRIARSYDRFNDLATFGLHRLWKRRLLAMAGARAGIQCLDLCAGSGDISLLLSRAVGARGAVVALDFSAGMLAVLDARVKRASAGQAPIAIVQGDASDLSAYNDGSFDMVTIGFGLRNVIHRERCLAECRRVLRAGGRLAILDVGKTPGGPIGFFHRLYFQRVVPEIGHWLEGKRTEMYEYLPASAESYLSQAELSKLLVQTGFERVQYRNLLFGAAVIHIAFR